MSRRHLVNCFSKIYSDDKKQETVLYLVDTGPSCSLPLALCKYGQLNLEIRMVPIKKRGAQKSLYRNEHPLTFMCRSGYPLLPANFPYFLMRYAKLVSLFSYCILLLSDCSVFSNMQRNVSIFIFGLLAIKIKFLKIIY